MKHLRRFPILTLLVALSSPSFAAGPGAQAASPQGQTAPAPAAAPAPQGRARVCLDVQTRDQLTEEFADRLRETIAASGALSLASTAASCNLRLHVPGNLLRFETQGGVMVGTVVIVTSASDHYLSSSITVCRASDFKPCAVRAVAAAKLALLMTSGDGT
ncbi:MAG: hypothetical protein ACRES6_01445 [Steroidobacteraceae bacterium]